VHRVPAALHTTPLNAVHRALGARMVDFGGWEMPLHYGSQIEEHHRVRRDAGMFDVSHMRVVDVEGTGAEAFLRRALANDVARLADGRALYSCMLDAEGGILDDLIVYRRGAQRYRLIVNAGTAQSDCEWLEAQRNGEATVSLVPRRDLALIAVQGPRALEKLAAALPDAARAAQPLRAFACAETGETFVGRTGYTGEDGVELMLPAAAAVPAWNALAAAGVAPAGLGARDTLRLEAGMSLYGQDMDATVTPFECGLGWTVALAGERDFTGRAALARRAPRWQQLGLVLLDKGIMRSHQCVRTARGDGMVTSGSFAPTLDRSIALARLPAGVAAGDTVTVEVRERALAARVVKPPFVRRGAVLVPV
jgi:aminomethyltransferase